MSKESNIEKVIPLAGTQNGIVSISKLIEPYGEKSGEVASIGISLSGDSSNLDWKVHIPLENLKDVIEALNEL